MSKIISGLWNLAAPIIGRGVQAGMPFLQSQMTKWRARAPYMAQGLKLAWEGGFKAMHSSEAMAPLRRMWASTSVVTLIVSAVVVLALATVFAPITALLAFFAPGVLAQLAMWIPKWSMDISQETNPDASRDLFMKALHEEDPAYEDTLRQRLHRQTTTQPMGGRMLGRVWRWFTEIRRSWRLVLIGLIPIAGPVISTGGQLLRNSEQLAADLLQPLADGEAWGPQRLKEFIAAHRWTLVGYCLPFALISAVPLVGGLVMPIAQFGIAHAVTQLTTPEHRRRVSRRSFSEVPGQEQDFERAERAEDLFGDAKKSKDVFGGFKGAAFASGVAAAPSAPKASPVHRTAAAGRHVTSPRAMLSPRHFTTAS